MSGLITVVGGAAPGAAAELAAYRKARLVEVDGHTNGHRFVDQFCADFGLGRDLIEDADFAVDDLLACWDLNPMALFAAAVETSGEVVVDAGAQLSAVLAAPEAMGALVDRITPLGWSRQLTALRQIPSTWQAAAAGWRALSVSDGSPAADRAARQMLTLAAWHGVRSAVVRTGPIPAMLQPFAVCHSMTAPVPASAPVAEFGAPIPDGRCYWWQVTVPGVELEDIAVRQRGSSLLVHLAGTRRRRRLPALLGHCRATGAWLAGPQLTIQFEPDPARWPHRLSQPTGSVRTKPIGAPVRLLPALPG